MKSNFAGRVSLAALAVSFALGCGPAAAEQAAPQPAEKKRPADWSDRSYYLPMQDGTRVAVSLYFPDGKEPAKPAPVIFIQTRYGRATQREEGGTRERGWLKAGYVLAVADVRGSTASFGPRKSELGPEEVRDMDLLIQHLATQPWSNGQVIAYGVSYMADTADWATTRPAPALVGSIPRQADFDIYLHLIQPGGVLNKAMMLTWGKLAESLDLGRPIEYGPLQPKNKDVDCRTSAADCAKLFPFLQPVDGDETFAQVREAMAGRNRWSYRNYARAEFRDATGGNEVTLFSASPAAALADIRREKKPVNYWGSWFDAGTADSALARFRSAPEVPAELWITANDHEQIVSSDPFFPKRKEPEPSAARQFEIVSSFAERVRAGQPVARRINYYVLGAAAFRQTEIWPPAGVQPVRLVFAPGRKLSAATAPLSEGIDTYSVDFDATTGEKTRWTAQLLSPADYPDRKAADRKLLTYDALPVTEDTELVGTPVVTLQLRAATGDPAVFVYLEDVAPDGRVTYLTEGQFRAIHRKPADPAALPYDQGPAPHSFRQADAQPVVPGEIMELRFPLFSTAALIRKGHRLRVAIAGADAGVFQRYSEGKPEVFGVRHGGAAPSAIEVTTRPWR